ncbi:capsid cement protein [Microbulbifer sp. TYP-18]|uniref:capsid cement protein n=1 Tax=Microbulbifer sp. TYP-18 TaxID=3230024 RepID=UPI0034C5C41D
MAKNYEQQGKVLSFMNDTGSDITSGSVVVMGAVLGIALADIANGEPGNVQIGGVFVVPKVSAADIKQGESLTWDISASAFDDNAAAAAAGDVTGPTAFAAQTAGAGATALAVCFTGVPGVVANP